MFGNVLFCGINFIQKNSIAKVYDTQNISSMCKFLLWKVLVTSCIAHNDVLA